MTTEIKKERIAKIIARHGVCSRRDADKLITAGKVKVNGTTLTTPAFLATDDDEIFVNGELLPQKMPTRLWRYYKPRGLVVSAHDEKGRATIFKALKSDLPRVVSVGRLDINSEGLLLLTNDGELSRHLELPATGLSRTYRVRAYGRITQDKLDRLKNGITIEGIRYGAIDAVLDREQKDNVWISVSLKEGKNREVRKVMEHLGLKVNRLIRISYGPFVLGELKEGEFEMVPMPILKEHFGSVIK